MLQVVYNNHIILLNLLKCFVELDDYSHTNEYTENCIATVTYLENKRAENRTQSV